MDIAVLINCRQDRVWHQHVNSVHPFRSVFFVAASSSTIQSKRQRKRQYNYTSVHALLITHKSLSSLKASGSTNRPAAARRHLLRLRDDAMPRDGHILPGSRENVTRPFFLHLSHCLFLFLLVLLAFGGAQRMLGSKIWGLYACAAPAIISGVYFKHEERVAGSPGHSS